MCLATCSGGWTVQHEMTALRVLYIQGSSPKFPLCPSRPITSGDPGCVITHALLKGATPTSLSSFTSQCLVTKAVSSDMHFWRSKGATPTSLSSFTSQCLVTKAVSSDMHFWRSKGATPTSLSSFTSQCLVTKAVSSDMHFWRSKGATPTSLSSFTLQCPVTKAASSHRFGESEEKSSILTYYKIRSPSLSLQARVVDATRKASQVLSSPLTFQHHSTKDFLKTQSRIPTVK